MLHWKIYIRHWRNKELQDLTVLEAGKKIIEWEAKDEKEIKRA